MYFHAARSNFQAAETEIKDIDHARETFAKLDNEAEQIVEEHYNGDPEAASDELEPVYKEMEEAKRRIAVACSPYLQHIALTYILCFTALEVHINTTAKDSLEGKLRDSFEKISIKGKWLFLPKMLSQSTFDPGSEPFQSFSKLTNYRNELIHYKGGSDQWNALEYEMPPLTLTRTLPS